MSFIIAVYVREGIVMASDSRLTLNTSKTLDVNTFLNMAISQTDNGYKTFLAPNNIGISVCGDACINDVPISGFMHSFINNELSDSDRSVKDVARKTVEYFRKLKEQLTTQFVVAGYEAQPEGKKQVIYQASVQDNRITQVNTDGDFGAFWNGDIDIFYRLMKPMWTQDPDSGNFAPLNQYSIHFSFFTLQDAVDFAVYAIRTTIDSMRFQTRNRTVGGPIDVLIIKPDGAQWLARKELHLSNVIRSK